MTDIAELRDVAARILRGSTDAGDEVYSPGDWSTWSGQYPSIQVRSPREQFQSFDERGMVEFRVTGTLEIIGKVQCLADPRDGGALRAERDMDRLRKQILKRIINCPEISPTGGQISQIPSIDWDQVVTSEGAQHLGELNLRIELEYYQGPEAFWNAGGIALTEIAIGYNQDPADGAPPIGADLTGLQNL